MNTTPTKRIRAAFDDRGVYVYQAFHTETVETAAAKGTFGRGFSLDRMTWIKPSLGWMLHRSGYAGKQGQEAIARIHLSHEGFRTILARSVPTIYDAALFSDAAVWNDTLRRSDVRCQWDPDRDLLDRRLERRAIQLGLRGNTVHRYVNEWILGIENITVLAHEIRDAVAEKRSILPAVPEEEEYSVSAEVARILGCD